MNKRHPAGACLLNAMELNEVFDDISVVGLAFFLSHPFEKSIVSDLEVRPCTMPSKKGIRLENPVRITSKQCTLFKRTVTADPLEFEFHDYLMQLDKNFFAYITKQEFEMIYSLFPNPEIKDNWVAVSGAAMTLSYESVQGEERTPFFSLKMAPEITISDLSGENERLNDGLPFYKIMAPCPRTNWHT